MTYHLNLKIPAGLVIWFGTLFFLPGLHPYAFSWMTAILLLGVLVLVPAGLTVLFPTTRLPDEAHLLGGIGMVAAFFLEKGWGAGALAVPWLMVTLGYVVISFRKATLIRNYFSWLRLAMALFLATGALWAVFDRMGWLPMGYSPEIIRLTAIHFHYGGFLLPLIAWRLTPQSIRLSGLVLAGMAAVATGIVLSNRLETESWEFLPVFFLVWISLMVAYQLWRRNLTGKIAAVLLTVAMLLAGAYGLRPFWPSGWLSIPRMYAFHGTLNVMAISLGLWSVWPRRRLE